MNKQIQLPTAILLLFLLTQISCISNKKHLAAIQSANDAFEIQQQKYAVQINLQEQQIDSLRISLATAEGGRVSLLESQMQFQEKIDALQDRLRNSQSTAQNTTQGLNQTLAAKDQQIASRDAQLRQLRDLLSKNAVQLDILSRDIQSKLGFMDVSVTTKNRRVHVVIPEKNNFPPNETRVRSAGRALLSNIAAVIQSHPELEIWIVGHSDNRSSRSRGNNWNFSSSRAAEVAKVLIDQYGVSGNQIVAAGQAEFSPKASNEDRSGQEMNRRVEIVFRPRLEYQIRDLEKQLGI
ncbi:MAG: OmpA family protein [Saprospiraceae bacterium]